MTARYSQSIIDTLITVITHLTMWLIKINIRISHFSCCWWVQTYFYGVCSFFCFFQPSGWFWFQLPVIHWWQIYVICFLTTHSHLISLNLLWMSKFWNVSMKICHYSLNFVLYFFCHLRSASWRQRIASFSGSDYTFYLQS